MKRPKSPPTTLAKPWSLDVRSGALAAGDEAVALATAASPALGRTPFDSRLLTLGFPKMILLSDEEVDVAALADGDRLHKQYYPWTFGVWPRSLVLRLVRRFGDVLGPVARTEMLTGPRPEPVREEEIDALVSASASTFGGRFQLFALEALSSTSAVAAAIIRLLARVDPTGWGATPLVNNAVGLLGAIVDLSRRLPALESRALLDAARSASEAVAAHSEAGQTSWPSLRIGLGGMKALDALHPPGNVLRFGALSQIADAPAAVAREVTDALAKMRPANRQLFDLQLGVRGGEETMRALCASVDRFPKEQAPSIVRALGRVRADLARPGMERLAAVPSTKVEARAWLEEGSS